MTVTETTKLAEWRINSSVMTWNVAKDTSKTPKTMAIAVEVLWLELTVSTRCRTGVVVSCMERSSTGQQNRDMSQCTTNRDRMAAYSFEYDTWDFRGKQPNIYQQPSSPSMEWPERHWHSFSVEGCGYHGWRRWLYSLVFDTRQKGLRCASYCKQGWLGYWWIRRCIWSLRSPEIQISFKRSSTSGWSWIATSSQKLSQHMYQLRFYLRIHVLGEYTWICMSADPRKGQMSYVKPLRLLLFDSFSKFQNWLTIIYMNWIWVMKQLLICLPGLLLRNWRVSLNPVAFAISQR
jgi:hypothetical protein